MVVLVCRLRDELALVSRQIEKALRCSSWSEADDSRVLALVNRETELEAAIEQAERRRPFGWDHI